VDIRQLDLNLLVALDALLTERSVTRAAERLGVTQSTMSGSLSRLRTFFNDALLVRIGREYRLTEMGQELAQSVREIIFLIESRIARRPVFNPTVDKHTFSIAASDYAMVVLGQPLLERMRHEAPGVRLHLQQHPGLGVYDLMNRGLIDIVISPDTAHTFPGADLLTERWVCAVSRDHPGLDDDRLSEELFLSLPHMNYAADAASNQSISSADRQLAHLGKDRFIAVRCESFLAMPFLLAQTGLVTLIQERLGRKLAETADVKLLEPPVPMNRFTLRMNWHPSRDSDSALLWLRQVLQEVGASI
jgi:DNA-binding transcriptional LysR family regulator